MAAQLANLSASKSKKQWLHIKSSSRRLDNEFNKLFQCLLQTFVLEWYSAISAENDDFIRQLCEYIQSVLNDIEERLTKVDWVQLVLVDIPTVLRQHVHDFRDAKQKLDSIYASNMSLEELFLNIQPHKASHANSEGDYVRKITQILMEKWLPRRELRSECSKYLVREIVADSMLLLAADKFSEPFFLYDMIVTLLLPSTPLPPEEDEEDDAITMLTDVLNQTKDTSTPSTPTSESSNAKKQLFLNVEHIPNTFVKRRRTNEPQSNDVRQDINITSTSNADSDSALSCDTDSESLDDYVDNAVDKVDNAMVHLSDRNVENHEHLMMSTQKQTRTTEQTPEDDILINNVVESSNSKSSSFKTSPFLQSTSSLHSPSQSQSQLQSQSQSQSNASHLSASTQRQFNDAQETTSLVLQEIWQYLRHGAQDKTPNTNHDHVSLDEPMVQLVLDVLQLDKAYPLLNKHLEVILLPSIRYFFSPLINKHLTAQVEYLLSEQRLIYYLRLTRISFWPNGQFAAPEPPKTAEETLKMKQNAREKMEEVVPDIVKKLLGPQTITNGIEFILDLFSYKRINKHLVYILLDLILHHLAPDVFVQPIQPTQQRGTTKPPKSRGQHTHSSSTVIPSSSSSSSTTSALGTLLASLPPSPNPRSTTQGHKKSYSTSTHPGKFNADNSSGLKKSMPNIPSAASTDGVGRSSQRQALSQRTIQESSENIPKKSKQ